MIYDVIPPEIVALRLHLKKFITSLPTRGFVYSDFAILIVYDERSPEKSYILKATYES